jgi:hypothetical protein
MAVCPRRRRFAHTAMASSSGARRRHCIWISQGPSLARSSTVLGMKLNADHPHRRMAGEAHHQPDVNHRVRPRDDESLMSTSSAVLAGATWPGTYAGPMCSRKRGQGRTYLPQYALIERSLVSAAMLFTLPRCGAASSGGSRSGPPRGRSGRTAARCSRRVPERLS